MRYLSLFLLAFFLLLAQDAQASKVLLPEDDSSSASSESAAPPVLLPESQPSPRPAAPSSAAQSDALSQILGTGASSNKNAMENLKSRMKQVHDERMKSKERDPIFLENTEIEPLDDPSLPLSLLATLSPSYTWGERDKKSIERSLGYDADSLKKYCTLRTTVTLQTKSGSPRFFQNLLPNEKKSIKYDEELTGAKAQSFALCQEPKVFPRNGALFRRVGKLLALQIGGQDSCLVPAGTVAPKELVIQYKGEGKISCVYR